MRKPEFKKRRKTTDCDGVGTTAHLKWIAYLS